MHSLFARARTNQITFTTTQQRRYLHGDPSGRIKANLRLSGAKILSVRDGVGGQNHATAKVNAIFTATNQPIELCLVLV